jgi:TonB family protein
LFAALGLCAAILSSTPSRAQDRVQHPGDVVSPTWPPPEAKHAPQELHFRGGNERSFGDVRFQFDGLEPGLHVGRYLINADPHDVVQVKLIQDGRASIESPGEWTGTGVITDSTYWGVFEYTSDAREAKNRGVRGTHWGTIDAEGRVHVEGRFTNRPWPPFASLWTQESESAVFRSDSAGVMRKHSITREELERIPVDVPDARGMQPPVWPPPQMRGAPSSLTPLTWPKEWYQGRITVMCVDQHIDAGPIVSHMVPLQMGEAVPQKGGLVVVRVRIEIDGAVSAAAIARSVPGLDEAALRAARLWRFHAAMRAGRPVAVDAYIPFLLSSM